MRSLFGAFEPTSFDITSFDIIVIP